jgi:hypothetical protein
VQISGGKAEAFSPQANGLSKTADPAPFNVGKREIQLSY